MSEVMSIRNLVDLPQSFGEMPQFSVICRAIWDSGEDMAWELAAYGIEASPNTCRNWMSGKTEPNITKGSAILRIAQLKDEQEIRKRRARIERIRSMGL